MRRQGGGGTRNDEEFDDENDLETADTDSAAEEIMFVVDVASACDTLEVFNGSIFTLSARPRRMYTTNQPIRRAAKRNTANETIAIRTTNQTLL